MSTTAPLQNTAAKPSPVSNLSHAGLLLQRKCACGGSPGLAGECEACKKKRLQKKLSIGASNDPLEQEADRVAEQVLSAPEHSAVSATPPRIQRHTGQATGEAGTAPASVDRVLSGSGRPLDTALQQDMGNRFGYDFSTVRVHTGSAAEQSARDVNAHAYTVGNNVVFGAGQFAPESHAGRKLIAHELTHVVQQSGAAGCQLDQGDDKSSLLPSVFSPVIRRQAGTGTLASTPAFSITQIPGIMTAMGWNPAAALMNDWFARPASASPSSGSPNTSAITVAWANGFSRALSVYNDMLTDKVWVNSSAQSIIKSRLVGAGLPGIGTTTSFGSVSGSTPALHANHVNHREVSQGWFSALDGLAGALANFSYYVVVQGTIKDIGPSPFYAIGTSRSYQVDIPQVAIYIRDSYDFNGDQDLGCWDPVANTVGRTRIGQANATCVTNETFRNWRTANSLGGDYYVFSDLDRLSTGDSFTFNW